MGVVLESNTPISRIRYMKLLFLVGEETRIRQVGSYYDFLPYRFGPYSFAAERELRRMAGSGLLQHGPLTGNGMVAVCNDAREAAFDSYCRLPDDVRGAVRRVVGARMQLMDPALIDWVYDRFPAYTVLSERAPDPPERPVACPAIYTLGYQGTSIDAFLNFLIRQGLLRLLDVRSSPVSRRHGYSKGALSDLCGRIGVDYVHLPELGIPPKYRRGLQGIASYQRLFQCYAREVLSSQRSAIERAAGLARGAPTALVCYEADHNWCHRGPLAERLHAITRLPICHLRVVHA